MKSVSVFVLLSALTVASIATAKQSCTDDEFVAKTAKDLPEGTAPILKRIVECNHWAGEVGDTSPERTNQIQAAIEKAKCNTLPEDQAAFIKRHAKLKKVEDAFKKADAWDGECD